MELRHQANAAAPVGGRVTARWTASPLEPHTRPPEAPRAQGAQPPSARFARGVCRWLTGASHRWVSGRTWHGLNTTQALYPICMRARLRPVLPHARGTPGFAVADCGPLARRYEDHSDMVARHPWQARSGDTVRSRPGPRRSAGSRKSPGDQGQANPYPIVGCVSSMSAAAAVTRLTTPSNSK